MTCCRWWEDVVKSSPWVRNEATKVCVASVLSGLPVACVQGIFNKWELEKPGLIQFLLRTDESLERRFGLLQFRSRRQPGRAMLSHVDKVCGDLATGMQQLWFWAWWLKVQSADSCGESQWRCVLRCSEINILKSPPFSMVENRDFLHLSCELRFAWNQL